uniref:Uncharacterized protein n=1 Tax=Rhizophora mucronata TaxID=61149 RepID=A0A2P2LK46_RHIMU
MGGCVSMPPKKVRIHKKRHRIGKRRVKIANSAHEKKRINDSRRVTDFAVSEFVHMDFENGATATCRRSGVSNSTFHLTQLQWHLNQGDSDVICQDEAWFDSVNILESDSDDEFSSVLGDRFSSAGTAIGNVSSGQVLQYESSSHFIDRGCKYGEYHESSVQIDGHRPGKGDDNKRKKLLDHSHGSFKGLKEDRRDSLDHALKSGLPQLVSSVHQKDSCIVPK